MLRYIRRVAPAVLLCALVFSPALPDRARAESDGEKIAGILLESWRITGLEDVRYETLGESGGTITIGGLSARYPQQRGKGQVLIGQMVLSGVTPDADGGFAATLMQVESLRVTLDDATFLAAHGEARDLVYPSPARMREIVDGGVFTPVYRSVEVIGMMSTTLEGRKIPIQRVAVETGDIVNGEPTSSIFAIEGVHLEADDIDDADAAERMRAMGYAHMDVNIRGASRWNFDDGNVNIEHMEFGAKDVGAIDVSIGLGGVTREFIAALRAQQKDGSKSEDGQQALMQHLMNITIRSLSVSFRNESIVERALDMQAREQGTTREALKAQQLALLPAILENLQNPAFARKVEAAIRRFMDNPKQLTIRAAPPTPLPAAQIFGMAMMMPAAIVTMLNLDVAAD